MAVSRTKSLDWTQRLVQEVQRDKKRTAILGLLALVGLFVTARVVLKNTPKRAKAVAQPAASASDAGAAGASPWLRRDPRADRARREEYLASMDRRIARDLFKPRLEYFPPAGGASRVTVPAAPAGPGWFGEVQDLAAERDRGQQARQAHASGIRAEAGSLSLTSTMMGSAPMAVINGRVLRPGDVINGFHLVSISSRKCALMKEEVTLELYMRAP